MVKEMICESSKHSENARGFGMVVAQQLSLTLHCMCIKNRLELVGVFDRLVIRLLKFLPINHVVLSQYKTLGKLGAANKSK